MSFMAVYALESGKVALGDGIATNAGYGAFLEWAEGLDGYPSLAALAEEGAADPEALAADLTRLLDEHRPHHRPAPAEGEEDGPAHRTPGQKHEPPPHVLHVARKLLEAVHEKPEGAAAVGVTDGSDGSDEEEGGEQPDLARAVNALEKRDEQQEQVLNETTDRLKGLMGRLGLN
jgi:hypothetical protein